MGNISMTTGKQMTGLNKVVDTNTKFTFKNAGAVKKLTAEQLLSLKVQKQLQDEFGVKATNETDPIQLEAARLNLIKQQNLAIQAVDASYLAFIEKQMKANENAQRYADILKVIKDGKISTEEIDNLAKAWGIPRDQVVAYISKVTGISQTDFPGLDAPGLSAASGWISAKAAVDAYYASILGSTPKLPPLPLTPAETNTILENGGFVPVIPGTGGVLGGSSRAGDYPSSGFPGSDMGYSGSGGYGGGSNTTVVNNFNITTVDPSKAGDAVVDAINSSTNIRGGFQGIGVSRAVTLL
jgi:hypothetical protein